MTKKKPKTEFFYLRTKQDDQKWPNFGESGSQFEVGRRSYFQARYWKPKIVVTRILISSLIFCRSLFLLGSSIIVSKGFIYNVGLKKTQTYTTKLLSVTPYNLEILSTSVIKWHQIGATICLLLSLFQLLYTWDYYTHTLKRWRRLLTSLTKLKNHPSLACNFLIWANL